MAEERGSRTHQTRLTRLTGFEIRARHRIGTFFQSSIIRQPAVDRLTFHR